MEVEATRRQKFPEKGQELEQDPSGGQMGKEPSWHVEIESHRVKMHLGLQEESLPGFEEGAGKVPLLLGLLPAFSQLHHIWQVAQKMKARSMCF